jgi:hypothetical protein
MSRDRTAAWRVVITALACSLLLLWHVSLATAQAGPAEWVDRLTDGAAFSGQILVPAADAPLFQGLSAAAIDPLPAEDGRPAGYQLWLTTDGQHGTLPAIELDGALGRWPDQVENNSAVPDGCVVEAGSCANHPSAGSQSQPGAERFFDLTVKGQPAVVEHRTCCDGESWSVAWYDPAIDQSFLLVLHTESGNSALADNLFGQPSDRLDPSHALFATRLTQSAAELVILRQPPAPPAPAPAVAVSPPSEPTPPPSASAAPAAPAASTCGAPSNPYGYTLCPGTGRTISAAPADFCRYFSCIPSFWNQTRGIVEQCKDGLYSHSGGVRGSCSGHGGNRQPLYRS